MEKTKLTKLEKYWILYDVGNSAFILLVSTIIPIYLITIISVFIHMHYNIFSLI